MFFLKDKTKDNTTIEIIVRYRGGRFKYATGEKVIRKYWNPEKERCKEVRQYEDAANINIRLETWERHVKKVLNDYSLKFKVPTQEEFKEALKIEAFGKEKEPGIYFSDFINDYKEKCNKSEGTKKAYQTTINWVEAYEEKIGKKLLFSDINTNFYNAFQSFVFASEKVNSPNFFGTLVKNIKAFVNVSGYGEESNLASFKKIDIDVDNIYLTVDELKKIHELKLTSELLREESPKMKVQNIRQKLEALELARGRFLIGAFTALRVSDFSRIEELNIKNNFIRIRTDKTDYPVVIPVHWIVKEILDRGFNLSEKISDQKINEHIKDVCKYAGLKDPVILTKFEAGKRIDVTKFKYEWVTTHTARRSGATNMYKAGIPTIAIMKITGHRTEKSFLKYIKVTQEENAQMLAEHPFFRKN